ncbi:hypothetical protein [Amycolatopsis suaedae]|uniref:DUF3558 domain-containing protein n=1 Tax=Amycolatopsis suaedae TaxID=2510978 RepID=A0A4Q7JCN5_9PSEU|nr:hypothetical protein [Amycolatopsis suaedae]RZQ64816.1 hypothetical protein EWH70_07995 [Amycolatopsis suaedae]
MANSSYRAWCRSILGLLAVALVSGCGSPSRSPAPAPASEASQPPIKYIPAELPSCAAIKEAVSGLPPVEKSTDAGITPTRTCTYRNSTDEAPYVSLKMDIMGEDRNVDTREITNTFVKGRFAALELPGDERITDLGVGTEARWSDPERNKTSCILEFLDENAILSVQYTTQNEDPSRSEQCRTGATDLARQLYAAIQPR